MKSRIFHMSCMYALRPSSHNCFTSAQISPAIRNKALLCLFTYPIRWLPAECLTEFFLIQDNTTSVAWTYVVLCNHKIVTKLWNRQNGRRELNLKFSKHFVRLWFVFQERPQKLLCWEFDPRPLSDAAPNVWISKETQNILKERSHGDTLSSTERSKFGFRRAMRRIQRKRADCPGLLIRRGS